MQLIKIPRGMMDYLFWADFLHLKMVQNKVSYMRFIPR